MKRGRRGSSSQRRRERLPTSTTRDFVELMLAGTTHDLWVCSLPNDKDDGGERHVRTRDLKAILAFCKKWDIRGRATYYCVSSIDGARRNLETVAETPILWFDLDYKDITCTPKQALARVRALPMSPDRLHATGHGLHGIYVLDKPWHGDIKPALRKLCDVVGGDAKVCHPAALMRMPGTHNSKDGGSVLVRVLKAGGGGYTQYGAELRLSAQTPVITRRGASAPDTDPFKRHAKSVGFAPPIDAEARLRAMPGRAGHGHPPDAAAGHRQPATGRSGRGRGGGAGARRHQGGGRGPAGLELGRRGARGPWFVHELAKEEPAQTGEEA